MIPVPWSRVRRVVVAAAAGVTAAAVVAGAGDAAGDVVRRGRLPRAVADADYLDGGAPDPAKVALGRALFFDKVLSGNRAISCATCHHPLAWTGDGLSLSVGEGGVGLGVTRHNGDATNAVRERVPRNAPPVFNLGARQFTVMFHDGRLAVDPSAPGGFRSPAGSQLPDGLDSALAAQAMFPVTSGAEMAGQAGENAVADAAAEGRLAGEGGVWDLLADRLRAIPEYVDLFRAAYPAIQSADDITFVHAANAIGAFEAAAWRADGSPFDRYLRGERGALTAEEKAGMQLFYGRARCWTCHDGPFQTDLAFHSIAMPQIGPGKGDGPSGRDDHGRERVTGDAADRYRFRTPTLRNVTISGPWGHDGAYDSLEAVVRHHLDPVAGLAFYDRAQAVLAPRDDLDAGDFVLLDDPSARAALLASSEIRPVTLRARDVERLLAFLSTLTDPRSVDLRRDVPKSVPSGLPVCE